MMRVVHVDHEALAEDPRQYESSLAEVPLLRDAVGADPGIDGELNPLGNADDGRGNADVLVTAVGDLLQTVVAPELPADLIGERPRASMPLVPQVFHPDHRKAELPDHPYAPIGAVQQSEALGVRHSVIEAPGPPIDVTGPVIWHRVCRPRSRRSAARERY